MIFFRLLLSIFLMGWMAESACPEGFEEVSGSCFFFHMGNPSYRSTWEDARAFCQEKGSDLAVIKDCYTFKELVRFIHLNSEYEIPDGASYWLGGSDAGEEGMWYWIDYTPMILSPPFWGSANGVPEPSGGVDQNCADMFKNDRYYFHDGECNETSFPLCQMVPI